MAKSFTFNVPLYADAYCLHSLDVYSIFTERVRGTLPVSGLENTEYYVSVSQKVSLELHAI